ncbi:HAD family hydrolase [Glutamicibacter endophyticus]
MSTDQPIASAVLPAPKRQRRAIFIDVDGTYAYRSRVPEAHAQAVRTARANGHLVFLSTGRPPSMLSDHMLAAGFDGLVASAGAYVRVGDAVLTNRTLEQSLAQRITTVLDHHGVCYLLESPETVFIPDHARPRLLAIAEQDSPELMAQLLKVSASRPDPWSKACVFDSAVSMQCLLDEIGPELDSVANSVSSTGRHSGELFARGLSKADGMELVLEQLDIAVEQSIAIGDGHNDIEMLELAGTAVGIDGAPASLLTHADFTVPNPEGLGLARAFESLGLTETS